MMDFPDEMTIVVVLFFVVFALNIVPAFAPPTWVTLSFVGLAVPSVNVVALAAVGATAATRGRIGLAKLSRMTVRRKFLSEQARLNVDALKQGLEGKKALTSTMFVAFALSPLPSNYLFIAYGLTSLPIMFLAVPFFIGRILELWLLGDDGICCWRSDELGLVRILRLSGRVLRAVSAAFNSGNLRLHAGRLARRIRGAQV